MSFGPHSSERIPILPSSASRMNPASCLSGLITLSVVFHNTNARIMDRINEIIIVIFNIVPSSECKLSLLICTRTYPSNSRSSTSSIKGESSIIGSVPRAYTGDTKYQASFVSEISLISVGQFSPSSGKVFSPSSINDFF